MELETLSDTELMNRTFEVAQREKKTTLELLSHLHEVERRRLYLKRGYGSLWEYVHKGLGYSEFQASERVTAMRFMFRTDETYSAMVLGTVNLTQASMTERVLRSEEKENKKPIENTAVEALVQKVQGASKRETEQILAEYRPEKDLPEKIKPITSDKVRVEFTISRETYQLIEKLKEIEGSNSLSEVFSMGLKFYVNAKTQKAKAHGPNSLPVENSGLQESGDATFPGKWKDRKAEFKGSRYLSVSLKRAVKERSGNKCEYRDDETHRRCNSSFQLQFDHIHPFAWGGTPELCNIRHLCAAHNRFAAQEMFQERAWPFASTG